MKLHLTIRNPRLLPAEDKESAKKELDKHSEEISQWLRTRYSNYGLFNDFLDLEYDTDTKELSLVKPEIKGPWEFNIGDKP